MSKLHEIASAIKTDLESRFQTVRVSAVQTPEQFTRELKAMNPNKLPGVIIVFDNLNLNSLDGIQEFSFTLVVVDKFTAASDARALSVFKAGADLLDLFPADGRTLCGMHVYPADCVAASPDAEYAALALGIICKQGF